MTPPSELALLAAEGAEHLVVLGVAQPLDDDLARGRGGDPAEALRGVVVLRSGVGRDAVLVDRGRVGRPHRHVPGLAVHLDAGLLPGAGRAVVGRQQRLLDGGDEDVEAEVALALQQPQRRHVDVHVSPLRRCRRRSPGRARPRSPRGRRRPARPGWASPAVSRPVRASTGPSTSAPSRDVPQPAEGGAPVAQHQADEPRPGPLEVARLGQRTATCRGSRPRACTPRRRRPSRPARSRRRGRRPRGVSRSRLPTASSSEVDRQAHHRPLAGAGHLDVLEHEARGRRRPARWPPAPGASWLAPPSNRPPSPADHPARIRPCGVVRPQPIESPGSRPHGRIGRR